MASRYKLLNGETSFVFQGERITAGVDGWLRPTSAEMERAMVEAGAVPAGVVASEDSQGKPVTPTETTPLFLRDGKLVTADGTPVVGGPIIFS